MAEKFVPTEDQILKELKQKELRKKYQTSPKAAANRKAYQEKRKAESKAMREYLEKHPDVEKKVRAEHPELFGAK